MKNILKVICFLPCLVAIALISGSVWAQNQKALKNIEVKSIGDLKTVFGMGVGTAITNLKDLKSENLYAIGPVEHLDGEITVLDGKPYIGKVNEKDKVHIQHSLDVKAPILVYSNVKKWRSFNFDHDAATMSELEKKIESAAKKAGLDVEKPFPFLIQGAPSEITFHIVRRKNESTASPGSHDDHGTHHRKKEGHGHGSAANMSLFSKKKSSGTVLGFFSKKHQGIYTHHDSFVHMHFLTDSKQETGHVDALKVNKDDGLQILFAEQ